MMLISRIVFKIWMNDIKNSFKEITCWRSTRFILPVKQINYYRLYIIYMNCTRFSTYCRSEQILEIAKNNFLEMFWYIYSGAQKSESTPLFSSFWWIMFTVLKKYIVCLKYAYYSQNIFLAVFASDCTIKLFIKSSKITQTIEAWRKMAEYIEQKNSQI